MQSDSYWEPSNIKPLSSNTDSEDDFLPAFHDRRSWSVSDLLDDEVWHDVYFDRFFDAAMDRLMGRALRQFGRLDASNGQRGCVVGGRDRKVAKASATPPQHSHAGDEAQTASKPHHRRHTQKRRPHNVKGKDSGDQVADKSHKSLRISVPGFVASQIKIKREAADQLLIVAKRNDPQHFELVRKRLTLPADLVGKSVIGTYNGQTVSIRAAQPSSAVPIDSGLKAASDGGEVRRAQRTTEDEDATVADESGE